MNDIVHMQRIAAGMIATFILTLSGAVVLLMYSYPGVLASTIAIIVGIYLLGWLVRSAAFKFID